MKIGIVGDLVLLNPDETATDPQLKGLLNYITPNGSNQDCVNVFQYFRFPVHLYEIEKTEEVEIMKKNGAMKIAKSTWFCHRPIFGLTCGQCNPCKDALNEGMAWRVSKLGRALGFVRRIYYGLRRRMARLLNIKSLIDISLS